MGDGSDQKVDSRNKLIDFNELCEAINVSENEWQNPLTIIFEK
jgi:hypothetical protein